jgi:hypothetical protein
MISRVIDGKHRLSFNDHYKCSNVRCRPESIAFLAMSLSITIVQSFMLNRYWVLYVNTITWISYLKYFFFDRTRRKFVTSTLGALILMRVRISNNIQLMTSVTLVYHIVWRSPIWDH